MIFFIFRKCIGVFKWVPLWAVTNYVGMVASIIYFIFDEGLMFRFYGMVWPLTICLLAKPGSQFLFQHYFGLFTNFRIPDPIYAVAPLVVLALAWLLYINRKYGALFFIFSLASVFGASVIVLYDAHVGIGPKLTDFRIVTTILAMAISAYGFSWLIVYAIKNYWLGKQWLNEDRLIREKFESSPNLENLQFFNLEEYLLDRRKDIYELLRELDGFLDSSEINCGEKKQLTTIVKFKTIIEFRATRVVFTHINQSVQPILECFAIAKVLPKIDGHDNMGFDFDIEYLPVMKQVLKRGIENYLASCNSNQCKICSCQMVS